MVSACTIHNYRGGFRLHETWSGSRRGTFAGNAVGHIIDIRPAMKQGREAAM